MVRSRVVGAPSAGRGRWPGHRLPGPHRLQAL